MSELHNCDALILCGGLGTRFQSVTSEQPKGLAKVAGKSILERLIDDLVDQGISRVVLCVGHLREQIIDFFKDRSDIEIFFSIETEPMGTAGALKNALPLVKSGNILVMNGDSLCSIQFQDLHNFHQKKKSFLTIVVSPSEDTKDYGNITLNKANRILSFNEKVESDSVTFINGGIYLIKYEILKLVSNNFPVSMEIDFFPEIIKKKSCFGYKTDSTIMDIGTPDRYQKINKILEYQTQDVKGK
jgi:NDP-sugar pyrophosphorylase family protein